MTTISIVTNDEEPYYHYFCKTALENKFSVIIRVHSEIIKHTKTWAQETMKLFHSTYWVTTNIYHLFSDDNQVNDSTYEASLKYSY